MAVAVSPPTTKSLIYRNLPGPNAIRLLRLQPELDHERIACSLVMREHYAFAPRYECLSYCWGSATDTVNINCNGHSLAITQNLHSFLLQLWRNRHSRTPPSTYLWADAICINQADISERNQQVSIMHKIFQHCSRVYVWLGPRTAETQLVTTMIRTVAQRFYEYSESTLSIRDWLLHVRRQMQSPYADQETRFIGFELVGIDDFKPPAWKSFYAFYDAEWFKRVWVIQEVRQQEDVYVVQGDVLLDWHHVGFAATWASRGVGILFGHMANNEELPRPSSGLKNADFMWSRPKMSLYERAAPFVTLLGKIRWFHASDARDKVFAILHHDFNHDPQALITSNDQSPSCECLEPAVSLSMQVDYRQTKLEIYREIAVRCLSLGSLAILDHVIEDPNASADWPSWVPDWTMNDRDAIWALSPSVHDAGKGSNVGYLPTEDVNAILLTGISIGTVESVESVLPKSGVDDCMFEFDIASSEQSIMRLKCLLTCNEGKISPGTWALYILQHLESSKADSYITFSTISCDICARVISEQGAGLHRSEFYHCRICSNGDFDICLDCHDIRSMACEYPSHILRRQEAKSIWIPCRQEVLEELRRYEVKRYEVKRYEEITPVAFWTNFGPTSLFFRTMTGHYGSSPDFAQVDDVVAIFLGGRFPFLLRKKPTGDYRILGTCYVDGLMNGEAIELWKQGSLKADQFRIR